MFTMSRTLENFIEPYHQISIPMYKSMLCHIILNTFNNETGDLAKEDTKSWYTPSSLPLSFVYRGVLMLSELVEKVLNPTGHLLSVVFFLACGKMFTSTYSVH